MPVLASPASLTPCLEEDGLGLALVEGRMDTPTPALTPVFPIRLGRGGVAVEVAGGAGVAGGLRRTSLPGGKTIN